MKNIIIFYHENCLDGFTGAYVAWKKFKEKAEYIPLSRTSEGDNILQNKKVKIKDLTDKEVYFIDFCLLESELKKVIKVAKKVIILDHHIGAKDLVLSMLGSIYSDTVSGSVVAFNYFFPKNKVPELLKYVSIGDTYSFSKNEKQVKVEKEVLAYLSTVDFDFKNFLKVEKFIEDKKNFVEIKKIGEILNKNFYKMIKDQSQNAKLIEFEGYKVYAVNSCRLFKSELGHVLAEKTNLFGIVYYFEGNDLKLSFRGIGKVDLVAIAQKYGGGGHFNASSFKTNDEKFISEFLKKIIS